MGKRNLVVLSSDEEDPKSTNLLEDPLWEPRRSSEPKPLSSSSKVRASSVTTHFESKKPAAKKARRLSSRSAPPKAGNDLDEFELFYKDFTEDFAEFKVSAGLRNADGADYWLEKYRPRTLEELAIHKKKVEEVKAWFEERLGASKRQYNSQALLVTGQTGVGKSATVHAVASHLGAEVFEWDTPTPTIWQEHVHNLNSGMRYISKLDEFENFVERVRKYGLLSSSVSGSTALPVILLIDDLPVMHGKIAHQRLLNCLQLLVKSVQIPTVIVVTDYHRSESGETNSFCSEDLSLSLESTGASKVANTQTYYLLVDLFINNFCSFSPNISLGLGNLQVNFNPITVNSIKKVLSRICKQERHNVTLEQIDWIANASEGDIRHAITSLQYLCLDSRGPMLLYKGTSITSGENRHLNKFPDGCILPFGRDPTLSLFHALGKFLHNKRETETFVPCSSQVFPLKEGFVRLPLKMDEPEKVLCQAYGQARPVAEFLHENVLDFIDEEAIQDASVVVSYLSDTDCLFSSLHRTLFRSYEAENIAQSAAASVAVRGALFGNAHPSPSRWHAIRRPKIWQMEQSVWATKREMERIKSGLHGLSLQSELSTFSTEYRPMLKWLGDRATTTTGSSWHPDNGAGSDWMSSKEEESEATDDEIEDW